MEKMCKKWLRMLPFKQCSPLTDDSHEVAQALKIQLEKMHHHRRETWREGTPKLSNHPLAIKRSTDQKKRVHFWDVFRMKHDQHQSTQGHSYSAERSTQGIDTAITEKMDTQKQVCFNDQIILQTFVTHMAPIEPVVESDDNNSADDSTLHCYENTNYINEEKEKERDHFVTSFGKKGKQVGEFEDAKDLVCLPDGGLVVTDMVIGRLQKFYNNASTVTLLGPEDVTHPWSVALTNENDIAVSLCKEQCVRVLSQDGERLLSFGEDYFQYPAGIACDKQGRFIVCDSKAGNVSIFSNTGVFIRHLGCKEKKEHTFSNPRYVCVSERCEIIVADTGHHKIKIFTENGDLVKSFGSFGKEDGQFKCPYGVCTDKFGTIYVADHYNSRISLFTSDGVFLRHIVTHDHGLLHPKGIKVDGNLYMYVTHGHLKATEVAIFKLSNVFSSLDYNSSEMISYV